MNVINYLEISSDQYITLYLMQKLLTRNDIIRSSVVNKNNPKQMEIVEKKKKWESDWSAINDKNSSLLFSIFSEREIIDRFNKENIQTKILLLLEAFSFVPYYPLSDRGSGVPKKEALTVELRKEWEIKLDEFVLLNSFPSDIYEKIKLTYPKAVKEISGSEWNNLKRNITIIAGAAVLLAITGGLAAPVVGTAIGGLMGLSGAAATGAGLAFLGGGAIAAGGAGMLGGTVVLVGGSAILGGIVGSKFAGSEHADFDFNSTVAFDTNFLISSSAKIETILIISVPEEHKTEFALEIIKNHKSSIKYLDTLIQLGEKLKEKHPSLSLDTIKKNKIILTNAIERLLKIASGV